MNSRTVAFADVAVVGGGIVGASIAWRLAQRGAAIELFDAGRVGGEASWAGAGMLAPGAEVSSRDSWAGLALESHAAYGAFVAELSAEAEMPVDYRECGAIELAFGAAEWSELKERAALQRGMGIESVEWDVSRAGAAIPGASLSGASGALYYPADAIVDPRDVTRALRRALEQRSAAIHENCPVSEIRTTEWGVEIVSAAGLHRARRAVLAAGAWSSGVGISTAAVPASLPVRGHLIGWRIEPGSLGPILRHGHTYLLQRSSGFLIAGTTQEHVGFDRTIDRRAVDDILARARTLLPSLLGGEPDEVWTGFRPATATGELAIGRVADSGVWLAYGHFRNGILMAPATAARMAAAITSS